MAESGCSRLSYARLFGTSGRPRLTLFQSGEVAAVPYAPSDTQAWKSPWLVTVFGRWQARSATGAIMEPPVTMGRNQEAKIPDEPRASIRLRDGAARGTP